MAKPANKSRGEETLPGLGTKLRLTIDALERIESSFPNAEHWLADVSTELRKPSPKVIRLCIEAGVEGDIDFDKIGSPGNPSWVDLGNHVVDALFMSIYGMTFDERVEFETQQEIENTKKKMQMMLDNPEMAEILKGLSSRESGAPVIDSESLQTE